jgi:uncharacterized membrane protein YdjX (TVP38/TMEM64 family)
MNVRHVARRLGIAGGSLAVAAAVAVAVGGNAEHLVASATRQAANAGAWGLVLFGGAYVAAALMFVPGSALTFGAGALFGVWRGTVVVSIASTTAAALAFLLARHLARGPVAALASRHSVFGAIDRAVSEGGWRVVGLLRLSPVMPFSAGNYLFGLTGVRFWPYVAASWLGMLPGTLLYVTLGHAGRTAVDGTARSSAEWALLGAGVLATAVVSVHLGRRAKAVLRGRTEVTATGAQAQRG